ncbi:unnamed protein product [Acanthoscelides obtectus]|uniref:Peptidase S1 domain-containing protein n=1 Tax=Acanthoscelides obtectus TaxID=200917 RepID=A0A9P0KJ60_ACAOB|nr:unnamed protein product [Acanthoscelides obtectus]CAK1674872.1 Phenoloxidase-activating factor 2 [Acanthoscelides obtectus]
MAFYLVTFLTITLIISTFAQIPGYVEVTSEGNDGGLGRIARCGENGERKMCVKYYQCDPNTRTVDKSGATDGFGIIDIRIAQNECYDTLEVCCNLPDDGSLDPAPKNPDTPPATPRPPPPTSRPPPPPTSRPPPPPTQRPNRPTGCGHRNADGIDFRIAGAENGEAEYGEFPWMVAVMKREEPEDGRGLLCGGSLLSDRVVLTGAHCVHKLGPRYIKVRVGEWDTQSQSERLPHQERDVSSIISHEDFNPSTLFNDMALLILERPVEPASHIGTICLPMQDQEIESSSCFVTGWGKDAFGLKGKYQAILKKIELPTVEFQQCQASLRKTRLGRFFKLDKSFMCAGGENGRDACTVSRFRRKLKKNVYKLFLQY